MFDFQLHDKIDIAYADRLTETYVKQQILKISSICKSHQSSYLRYGKSIAAIC